VVVSLNLLTFPGFTDRTGEVEALLDFIGETEVQMVQLRNLSADPDWVAEAFPLTEKTLGILGMIRRLKAKHPHLRIGSFTHPAASFRRRGSR
jgi:pyruvate-formate lyase-activating enzyme